MRVAMVRRSSEPEVAEEGAGGMENRLDRVGNPPSYTFALTWKTCFFVLAHASFARLPRGDPGLPATQKSRMA